MAEDWQAISNLLMHYAELVDAGQLAECAELFSQATYRVVRTDGRDSVHCRGAEEVAAFFSGTILYADGTPRTKHLVSNVAIELDGDRARARSYVTVLQQTEVLPLQPIASGCYVDELARIDGRWTFTDRMLTSFLLGDRSQHVEWSEPTGEG
jgi:3-phenylpropionate/cinnamic acid dioxygenase small subunit